MSGANHVNWFATTWRNAQRRFQVMGEYRALARSKYLLADIALRGGVYHAAPADATTLAFNNGRRSLALEIIELANTDPTELFDLVERYSGAS